MLQRRLLHLNTLLALGLRNLIRVAIYRLCLRAGVHPVQRIKGRPPEGPFFSRCVDCLDVGPAPTRWDGAFELFWIHRIACKDIPDWHVNPLSSGQRAASELHWFKIPDFQLQVGDIKTVWEYSRFEWVIAQAQRAALADHAELERLNTWLVDWSARNPPYLGVNWKCGQEASIRVLHLAVAALVMGQVDKPQTGLLDLLRLHLARIAPTIGYAVGQQNNHGTSEAAALFVGGSWLQHCGDRQGRVWAKTGRRWLENRALQLIDRDGTFSQYSVVYHRLMLDTYSLVEVFRRKLNFPVFSAEMLERLRLATEWLRQMTDPATGDAPNIGANDGARLMPLSDAPFRDFRPSVHLAGALFQGARIYDGVTDCLSTLKWLGVSEPVTRPLPLTSVSMDGGGFHILRNVKAVAYLRYPRFRFRPSQADALHLDFWVRGCNVLRDAGTFSYNSTDEDLAYFGGTRSHNTVEFDGRDQMPRISRFLFGDWLRASGVEAVAEIAGTQVAAAGYRDSYGAEHHRKVELRDDLLVCRDTLSGSARQGVLRWRLAPGDWVLSGMTLSSRDLQVQISVEADAAPLELRLVEGWESRHYLEKTSLPVLEVALAVPSVVTTRVSF